ncbi:unnamed protein product, partial [Staurois parvus]
MSCQSAPVLLCPSVLAVSATHQCCLSVPISAAYQC